MLKTREVFTDGLKVDSALAKPIDLQETHDLIACCIRARLPQRVLSLTIRRRCARSYEKCCRPAGASSRPKRRQMDRRRSSLPKKQRFDIVFLDCQMPGHRRFRHARMLKKRASGHGRW